MIGICNVLLCECVCVCMFVFCIVWLCVFLGFVLCGCVYV